MPPASTSPSARARAAIVARLRAAGCVFAEEEADLLISSAATSTDLSRMVDRRAGGVPLEYVMGWTRFCGIEVIVMPGVFVPRARTALLVREGAALVGPDSAVVVDLCCGTGAIGAAIAASVSRVGRESDGAAVRLYAVDIDPVSVECARRNLEPFGGHVYQGDLFASLPEGLRNRIDVLVANVPYVPTAEVSLLPAEARLYEPHLALDGGADGLDILRRVATQAPTWLAAGGHLLVETSERQAPVAVEIMREAGLGARVVHDEDLDATAVIGSRGDGRCQSETEPSTSTVYR